MSDNYYTVSSIPFLAKMQDLGRLTVPVEARNLLKIPKGGYVYCTIEKATPPKRKDYTYKEFE